MPTLPTPSRERLRLAMLTFELFWVLVFALHAATGGAATRVTEFVYANF
jgi:hypothetical protein